MKFIFFDFKLKFNYPVITSRGVLFVKKSFFVKWQNKNYIFLSECPYFYGLSCETEDLVIKKLHWLCNHLFLSQEEIFDNIKNISSVLFAYEQILYLLNTKKPYIYIPSKFTKNEVGIKINGLIWSGELKFIEYQVQKKIHEGYKCLKFKIGFRWLDELEILRFIRKKFSENELEIRVDANGCFNFNQAQIVLQKLKTLKIHSIEQPIKKNCWIDMHKLCKENLIPIALDEELIGVYDYDLKEELILNILPQYLVLKPSLIGGIKGTLEWIHLCYKYDIKWWITSALESNIGLNFIAQFTYSLNVNTYQGLGTGNLFKNNYYSPLFLKKDQLFFSFNDIIKH